MKIALHRNERIRIDGIAWAVKGRTSTGFQLLGVGDGAPRTVTDDYIVSSFFSGSLAFLNPTIDPDDVDALDPNDIDYLTVPVARRQRADCRCGYLTALDAELGAPPYSDERLKEILPTLKAKADPEGTRMPSIRSLRRWIERALSAGGLARPDVRMQIPNIFGRQGRGSARVSTEAEAIMDEVLEARFMKSPPEKVRGLYSTVFDRIMVENALRPDNVIPMPSERTFYRRAEELDDEERIARQKGAKAADDAYGTVGVGALERIPMGVLEIDHNYLDCLAIDDDGVVLGRPTLTVAIDRYSKMIVGFAITFDPPSSLCTMLAIRHCVKDKGYVATAYPEIRHVWPCFGVPGAIVVDNGADFHSEHFKNLCKVLGHVTLIYAEPGRPKQRRHIERWFRTLNDQCVHLLPGTTLSRVDRDSDYDPSTAARLTLSKILRVLHKYIVDIYHQDDRRKRKPKPVDLWNAGVERDPLRLPRSLRDLEILSCPCERRKLRKPGIEMHNTYFRSDLLTAARVEAKGDIWVDVYSDPLDLSHVWVQVPGEDRFIEGISIIADAMRGKTKWHNKQILDHLGAEARNASIADVHRSIHELSEMANEGVRKASRKKRTHKRKARLDNTPMGPEQMALAGVPADAPSLSAALDHGDGDVGDEAASEVEARPDVRAPRARSGSATPVAPAKTPTTPRTVRVSGGAATAGTASTGPPQARRRNPPVAVNDDIDLDAVAAAAGFSIRRGRPT